MSLHEQLAGGRWYTFPLAHQLAHVGSEVDRAIRAHRAGKPDRFERALERALELFDLTAANPDLAPHRRREVLRAREEFCRLFFDDAPPGGKRRRPESVFPPVRRVGADSGPMIRRHGLLSRFVDLSGGVRAGN